MGEHNDHNNSNTTHQDYCQRDCRPQLTRKEKSILVWKVKSVSPRNTAIVSPAAWTTIVPLKHTHRKRKTRKDRGQHHPPLPAPPPPPSPYPPPGSPQPAVHTLRSVTLLVPVNRPFPPLIVPGYRRKIHNPQG